MPQSGVLFPNTSPVPIFDPAAYNTISVGNLQREFSSSPGSFNTLGDGSVSVSPESVAGQQIITDWQAALGPFPLRFRPGPGGLGIPGWRRALASSSGGSGGSAAAPASIPLWLILLGGLVLVFVIFD